jgi:bacillolysin
MLRLLRRTLAVILAIAALAILTASVRTAPGGPPGERFTVFSGRELRDRVESLDRLERARELRLRTVQNDALVEGRRHERLDQYYKGVHVFGGEVVRETDGKIVLGVTGTLHTGIAIDTAPSLEPEDALAVFDRETGNARTGPASAPELVILPRDDGRYALAYRVTAFVNGSLPVVFVNAKTGGVELRYDNLQTQAAAAVGRGIYGDDKKIAVSLQGGTYQATDLFRPTSITTYDLRGNVQRMLSRLTFSASDVATSTSATWADAVVVDAHCYLGWTYDFYYKRFGWKGLDNRDGRAVNAIVHPANRSDMARYVNSWSTYGNYYANASFCGGCGSRGEDVLMLGEGLATGWYVGSPGQSVTYYAASIDIVAHEYTHGVTGYTSNLTYRNESGALNESFSDMMGTAVEFYWQPVGTGALKSDYLHGEDTYLPSQPGSVYGTRSLENPAAYGSPDHYSKRYTGTDDNGGVHTNSGISNNAYYLAIEGGTNRTSGLLVHGVGFSNREQIEKVFFRALTTLPSDATFSQARQKTIQSARDLYGTGGTVERAVTEAWTAVGVQ